MIKKYTRAQCILTVAFLLFVHISVANAATVVCSGQVQQVSYHAGNGVMLKLDSMNTAVFICNPGSTWTIPGSSYSTSAEECRTLVSMFLSAKLTGKALGGVYFDGDAVPESCSSWTVWSKANIRYFDWVD